MFCIDVKNVILLVMEGENATYKYRKYLEYMNSNHHVNYRTLADITYNRHPQEEE